MSRQDPAFDHQEIMGKKVVVPPGTLLFGEIYENNTHEPILVNLKEIEATVSNTCRGSYLLLTFSIAVGGGGSNTAWVRHYDIKETQ